MTLDFEKYKEQQFCDNTTCAAYGQIGQGNIRTHSRQQQQVYCKDCKQIWVITKGTFFYLGFYQFRLPLCPVSP